MRRKIRTYRLRLIHQLAIRGLLLRYAQEALTYKAYVKVLAEQNIDPVQAEQSILLCLHWIDYLAAEEWLFRSGQPTPMTLGDALRLVEEWKDFKAQPLIAA